MFKIIKKILERKLKYQGEVVLSYHIEYPQIVSNKRSIEVKRFNIYNEQLAVILKNKSEREWYQEAIELYRYNQENEYPMTQYEIVRTCEITLHTNQSISLYADEYLFSGGAHGITTRSSQNWNMASGRLIKLAELYPKNPYFLLAILQQINEQITQNQEIYFEDACCLVIETFHPESFYRVPNGIVIYFQQYDIAPYSSGIREFDIQRK